MSARKNLVLKPEFLLVSAIVLLAAYFATHLHLFIDETLTIQDGAATVRALFSGDEALRARAARIAACESVGFLVTGPAGLMANLVPSLVLMRLVQLAWTACFWLGGLAVYRRWIAPAGKPAAREITLGAVALILLIQSIPSISTLQAQLLGEIPGLAMLLWAAASFLDGKRDRAFAFIGAAVMTKPWFFPYALLALGATAAGDLRLKRLARAVAAMAAPVVAVQLVRLAAGGPHRYVWAWQEFLHFVRHESGITTDANVTRAWLVAWTDYVFQVKAFCVASVALPPALLFATRKILPAPQRRLLAAVSLVAAVTFGHWLFIAKYHWLRRAMYFLVPGLFASACTILFVIMKRPAPARRRALYAFCGASALLFFALYLPSELRHAAEMTPEESGPLPLPRLQFHEGNCVDYVTPLAPASTGEAHP